MNKELEEIDEYEEEEPNDLASIKNTLEKKKQKFDIFMNSSRPSSINNVLKMTCISIVFLIVAISDFAISEYCIWNVKWLIENQRIIGRLQMYSSFEYLSIFEGSALGIKDYTVDGVVVRQKYLDLMLEEKKKLLQYLISTYPPQLKTYQDSLSSFMLTNLCTNYFKPVKGVLSCNSSLYDSGLDTVIIYVGQICGDINGNMTANPSDSQIEELLESTTMSSLGRVLILTLRLSCRDNL